MICSEGNNVAEVPLLDDENVVWHPHVVTRVERETANGQQGVVLWFTGLSGSGC